MIDREARNEVAQLLRDFISGKISNDDFEDSYPDADDEAILAIWSTSWILYDDFKKHKLSGRYKLSEEQKKQCIRWIIFLDSDLQYKWPQIDMPGVDASYRKPRGLIDLIFPLYRLRKREYDEFYKEGDHRFWPFISESECQAALAKPKRLSGGRLKSS